MSIGDWILIAVQGFAVIYFPWRQNQIFKRQNEIFAAQGGKISMPSETSRTLWLKRYWPTLVMVGLIVLTGFDIYDRHAQSMGNYETPKVQWGCKPSAKTGGRFETYCFATTDKAVPHGLNSNLHCNHELLSGGFDDGSQYGPETDYGPDPKDSMRFYLHFRTRTPAFDPAHPIVVRLVSNAALSCVIPPTMNLY